MWELKEFAHYNSAVSPPSGAQRPIIVPWSKNNVVIRNLNPGTQYRILVSAHTTAGVTGKQALTDRPLN